MTSAIADNEGRPESLQELRSRISGVNRMYQLRVKAGAEEGRVFPLTGQVVIGRAPECDIVLDRESPGSRLHASVYDNGANGWRVRDMGSSNGTFVNEKRLDN